MIAFPTTERDFSVGSRHARGGIAAVRRGIKVTQGTIRESRTAEERIARGDLSAMGRESRVDA